MSKKNIIKKQYKQTKKKNSVDKQLLDNGLYLTRVQYLRAFINTGELGLQPFIFQGMTALDGFQGIVYYLLNHAISIIKENFNIGYNKISQANLLELYNDVELLYKLIVLQEITPFEAFRRICDFDESSSEPYRVSRNFLLDPRFNFSIVEKVYLSNLLVSIVKGFGTVPHKLETNISGILVYLEAMRAIRLKKIDSGKKIASIDIYISEENKFIDVDLYTTEGRYSEFEYHEGGNFFLINIKAHDNREIVKDFNNVEKDQILSEHELVGASFDRSILMKFKQTLVDSRNKHTEKKSVDKKLENLVSRAERLIGNPILLEILTHIEEMETSLEKAIDSDFYNLRAYYINLGHLHYILTDKFNYDLSPVIKDYYLKALEINPESQNSRIGLAQYYLRECMFTSALKYTCELTNWGMRDNFIARFSELSSLYIPTNRESNYEALQLLKQIQTRNGVADLLRLHLYFWVGDLSSAQNEYNQIVRGLVDNITNSSESEYKNSLEDRLMRIVVNSLVWISNLDHSGSTLEQRKAFINSMIREGEAILPRNEIHFDIFQTNKCCALLTIEEYQKVVDILSKQIITNPNNTDFSNIAFGYYGIGDINKAKYYANKAFATQVDEQILNLLVLISFVEKDYPRALEYALQSLAYIEKQTDGTQEYIDNNGNEITSFSNSYYSKEKADFLQKTMVNVFITSGYYEAALKILDERIANNPSDMEYLVLKTSTEKLIEMDRESVNKIKELEEKYLIINVNLEKKIRIQNQMRELLNNFVSLQNSFDEVDSDDDISNFLSNVQKNMTNYVNRQHNPKLNEKVRKFEKEFKKQFNRLEKLSLEQLSIAEALFEEFDYAPLDYGMLAVIYGKVIEIELQKLLKRKGYTHTVRISQGKTIREKINWSRGLKIAECRDLLINDPVEELEDIDKMIEVVRKARNNSAHTGGCTLETISNIRNYLYEQNWLNRLNSQL